MKVSMKKRKSLEPVHTHTHTHTTLCNVVDFLYPKYIKTKKADEMLKLVSCLSFCT